MFLKLNFSVNEPLPAKPRARHEFHVSFVKSANRRGLYLVVSWELNFIFFYSQQLESPIFNLSWSTNTPFIVNAMLRMFGHFFSRIITCRFIFRFGKLFYKDLYDIDYRFTYQAKPEIDGTAPRQWNGGGGRIPWTLIRNCCVMTYSMNDFDENLKKKNA